MVFKAIIKGISASIALLVIYFGVVTLISGWPFAVEQFSRFWYFILSLAVGFGIQVVLWSYIKAIQSHASKKVLAVSGGTSTVAMLSCCSHYLANILPLVCVSGGMSLIGQYQVELFWLGLAFNVFGIIYIGNKALRIKKINP